MSKSADEKRLLEHYQILAHNIDVLTNEYVDVFPPEGNEANYYFALSSALEAYSEAFGIVGDAGGHPEAVKDAIAIMDNVMWNLGNVRLDAEE